MRSEKIKPHQTTFLQIEVLISYRFYITGISNYTSFLLWQMCIFSFFSHVGLISPHLFIYTNSFRFFLVLFLHHYFRTLCKLRRPLYIMFHAPVSSVSYFASI